MWNRFRKWKNELILELHYLWGRKPRCSECFDVMDYDPMGMDPICDTCYHEQKLYWAVETKCDFCGEWLGVDGGDICDECLEGFRARWDA